MTFNPQPKVKPVRLRGVKYSEFRKQVFERENGICEHCGSYARLNNQYGYWDWNCGDVSHIRSRGAGGSDTLDNAQWLCHQCHINRDHSPRWGEKV